MGRSGTSRSVVFSPVAEPRDAPEPAKTRLHEEPTDPILLYGEMLRDVKVITDLLRELPQSAAGGYHGTLRSVIGAADRLKKRAIALVGE